MRIRKRWPPPPVAPPPESLHHQQQPKLTDPLVPRTDLQLTLVKATNGWICKTDDDDDDCMHSNSSTQLLQEASTNDNKIWKISPVATTHSKYRKENSSCANDSTGVSSSASASHREIESAMRTSNAVKTKTQTKEGVVEEDSSDTLKKRKIADKECEMTEGSRCSRNNGTGWRCWKQAVSGYSLCEHHSSQGRHRNTTSSKDGKQGQTALSSLPTLLDEEPLIMLKKRRKKTGMKKNRSISGLLAQTEPQPAPAMHILDSVAML